MNSKKSLPWFRLYTETVDDEKLRLLAFEDRWHFIALLCLKGQGLLDEGGPLLMRKVAVKLGLDTRALEEVARRLAEVGLIDQNTFQPLAWDKRQMKSDSSAERVKAFRERKKQVNKSDEKAPKTGGNGYCNVTVTAQDTDTDTDINKPQQPARARAAAVPAGGGGAFSKELIEAAAGLGLSEAALAENASGATDEQLQILLQLYQSPPPDVRNPTGFAIWQARRAAAGQLPATLTMAEDKSSSTLSDEDKKRIEQQAQLQKLANEKEFAKIAALNAARRKVTHINELLSLR